MVERTAVVGSTRSRPTRVSEHLTVRFGEETRCHAATSVAVEPAEDVDAIFVGKVCRTDAPKFQLQYDSRISRSWDPPIRAVSGSSPHGFSRCKFHVSNSGCERLEVADDATPRPADRPLQQEIAIDEFRSLGFAAVYACR